MRMFRLQNSVIYRIKICHWIFILILRKKYKISQGFNITNTGKTNLSDGIPAYEIDALNNNTSDKSIIVIMNKNHESYYFVYNAKPDKFNTYLPIAQQMFKTLSFK